MKEKEWFRAGVGLVVANHERLVLAFERADVPGAWQLPQGGLELGEDSNQAAWRELREETGLTHREVDLEASSEEWSVYELPQEMRSSKTGRGQVHKWFLFLLRQGAELPPLPSPIGGEFRAQRWMTIAELIGETVSFRKPVYRNVGLWFSDYLKEIPG